MKKGKTLPLSLIKKICAAILIKHSYSQISKLYLVGKSTIQRCKQCLEKAKITALNDFFKLDEEELAKIQANPSNYIRTNMSEQSDNDSTLTI